jgi:hypothetical protein
MNWYIAKVIFQISTGSIMTQFDEHLRLIQADDREEAILKARMLGITEEDQFFNEKKDLVKWEFVNVTDVWPLEGLRNGVELYSTVHETHEANRYIREVHLRAMSLQANITTPA